MEKGINSYIKEFYNLSEHDIKSYSPLTLAYIGDAIFDLVIRTIVVNRGNTKPGNLHNTTSQLVKAHAQSEMMYAIDLHLTEEEKDVFRRGRNAKSPTMAKNATMMDYRRATGFEALIGYLYLQDAFERILELVKYGLDHYDVKSQKVIGLPEKEIEIGEENGN